MTACIFVAAITMTTSPAHSECLEDLLHEYTPIAGADTLSGVEEEGIWTVDELKGVLGREAASELHESRTWRSYKNPRLAMLCSLLIPGLGQLYNERPFKAAVAMGVETFYLSMIIQNYRNARREEALRDTFEYGSNYWYKHDWWTQEYKARSIDWAWWSAAVVVVVVLDAYIDAHLNDMNFKIEGGAGEGTGGLTLVVEF